MITKPEKKSFLDSFTIEDQESCAKAIKNGGTAALISAAITSVFGFAGFFTNSDNKDLNYFLDPWILADVALIIVLGLFVFRKSRIASTLLVIYFVGAKALMWIELGKPTGLVMSIIFLLYYATAMRGTYLWHKRYRYVAAKAA
jgi:hypothetical protein